MRATGLVSAAGSSALLVCLLAPPSAAQAVARQRAPIVRVFSQDGSGVVSNYVTPAIEVSEDAYVFAVMMDLDGRIQVLHPDGPGISVRIRSHKQLRLPNFFAGFNEPMRGSATYTPYGLVNYDGYETSVDDTRGTVIALASRSPFNLELIESDGDWNISAIRRLIEHRSPASAVYSLAQYLGARGESIGQDYMRFAGRRQSYYAYNDAAYCGYSSYGYSFAGAIYRARALGLRPIVVGYDACGLPIVVVAPFTRGGVLPVRPPRPSRDTTVFPKSRLPQGISRHPLDVDAAPRPVAAEGVFPLPQRTEALQRREPAMRPPQARRAEPREVPDQFRSQPVQRPESQPLSRPEPRVMAPLEPARAPERVRETPPAPSPAPVVHQRPVESSPPPPPPRAQSAPPARLEPVRAPPPRR